MAGAGGNEDKQAGLMKRSSELLNELLSSGEECTVSETESTIELNLYALKMKHTVKKTRKE